MVTMRFEPLAYLLKTGLMELGAEHWEVEGKNERYDFNPDWEEYQALENDNALRMVAVRENDVLVGYASVIIFKGAQYKGVKRAQARDIYLTENKRGHAAKLIRFIEKNLIELGVDSMVYGELLDFEEERGGIGKFYQHMGYKPYERTWIKVLQRVEK